MKTTSGSWRLSQESKLFPTSTQAVALDIARLVAFGAVATALHAVTRGRFELPPGHQGVAWIAVVLIGRLTSELRWAGMTTAVGASAATFMPVWQLGDPFLWIAYLTAGATVDLFCGARPAWHRHLWMLAIVAGIAHATKPLLRVLITGITGWRYESLLAGLPYPLATHFMFGIVGALLAAGALRVAKAVPE